MADPSNPTRVFATKPFMRFARKFGIGDAELLRTVHGDFDADLGGGVFKFRLARHGEGSSGGARAIVAMKAGHRVVLMFGFEKSDQANIKANELREFRKAARVYLGFSDEQMTVIVREKALLEIKEAGAGKGERHGKGV
jgi:hypothetical protein